ncbi:type II toxin-antitoxin system BrnA family antitoxin [Hippea sp. KM1]|uniref:type II toxin-antitoxin system BrnA family antitoxin n=1 Tax=Hippea sp. KM1 TaxID=944481 RepID=UPI0004A8011C|nr:CopG family antitoxin [Hippea sp. KM1]
MKRKAGKITNKEFDDLFDKGEDITEYLDTDNSMSLDEFESRYKIKRVNVDFPSYIVDLLDKEAKKIGVTRQSLIKMWISEKIFEKSK